MPESLERHLGRLALELRVAALSVPTVITPPQLGEDRDLLARNRAQGFAEIDMRAVGDIDRFTVPAEEDRVMF